MYAVFFSLGFAGMVLSFVYQGPYTFVPTALCWAGFVYFVWKQDQKYWVFALAWSLVAIAIPAMWIGETIRRILADLGIAVVIFWAFRLDQRISAILKKLKRE